MHAISKVRENFLERSGKSQGILKSWNAGHPVYTCEGQGPLFYLHVLLGGRRPLINDFARGPHFCKVGPCMQMTAICMFSNWPGCHVCKKNKIMDVRFCNQCLWYVYEECQSLLRETKSKISSVYFLHRSRLKRYILKKVCCNFFIVITTSK